MMTPITTALFAFGEVPTKTSDLEKVGKVFESMKQQAAQNAQLGAGNNASAQSFKSQLIKQTQNASAAKIEEPVIATNRAAQVSNIEEESQMSNFTP